MLCPRLKSPLRPLFNPAAKHTRVLGELLCSWNEAAAVLTVTRLRVGLAYLCYLQPVV